MWVHDKENDVWKALGQIKITDKANLPYSYT